MAAAVELDPRWLAGVTIDDRHPMRVWVTFTEDPGAGFHVEKSATGFDVICGRRSSASFDWRVEGRQ